MATAAVHTPVKSHSNIFSTRTAGGRIPLTPSPRARAAGNGSPFTPPQKTRRDPDWHIERKPSRYADNAHPSSLQATFAALNLSNSKTRSQRIAASPKYNISKGCSPLRLDLGVSDWALTGSGTAAGGPTPATKERCLLAATCKPIKAKPRPTRPAKTTIRMNGDRFIPTRSSTSPTAPTAATKADNPSRPATSTRASSVDSVLVGGAFGSNSNISNTITSEDCDEITYKNSNIDSEAYNASVAAACGLDLKTRILAFKPVAPESTKPIDLRTQYNRPLKSAASAAQFRRRILTAPERVLDAPGLVDDYYLNLLDWSSGNQVAIGLERNVYVWNAETGSVNSLLETSPDTYVSSVKWSDDGAYVAVGLGTGDVEIWDVEDSTKLRTMSGHETRVGVMSWNKALLSTGSRSGNIFNHDVRIAEHKTAELLSHTSEVCGLEWRSDGAQLASGGNDNLVNIWDARSMLAPKWSKTNHKAAVKAIAWCPWQMNLLATGGGSYDKHIHFWNATTGARVNSIDTGSQVTSLRWSTHYREIVSCHGFPDNQLSVWSYPTLVRNVEIPAHETRVLHSALSPDGQMLATCASDESLKFWKLFEKKAGPVGAVGGGKRGSSMATEMTIR